MTFIVKRVTKNSEKINNFLKELFNDSYIIEVGRMIFITPRIVFFNINLKYTITINEMTLSDLNKVIKNNEFDLRIFRNKTDCELIPYKDYKTRLEYFCRLH